MNYVYGTWSVLCALNLAGVEHGAPEVRKAVDWLVKIQNDDGGWGEGGVQLQARLSRLRACAEHCVADRMGGVRADGGGRGQHPAVTRGIKYLVEHQGADGFWNEPRYTATGSARVLSALSRLLEILPAVAMAATAISSAATRAVAYGM